MINTIVMTVKMIIYSNRNSSTVLHLKEVKMVRRDIFLITKYWAEIDNLPSFLGVWHSVYTEFHRYGS